MRALAGAWVKTITQQSLKKNSSLAAARNFGLLARLERRMEKV